MKFSFSHVVGIIGAPVALIAQLNPAIMAALYPPAAPYSALIVAAAVALVNLVHAMLGAPAVTAPSTATVVKVLPLAAVLVAMSGCATVSGWLASPTGEAVAIVAVDVAVATAESKGVPASQINKIAKAALAADTGVSGTLEALSALVDQQIAASGLPAADLAAAKILEVAISASITAKIGSNKDLAAAQAAVAVVLQEAIAASGG